MCGFIYTITSLQNFHPALEVRAAYCQHSTQSRGLTGNSGLVSAKAHWNTAWALEFGARHSSKVQRAVRSRWVHCVPIRAFTPSAGCQYQPEWQAAWSQAPQCSFP